jgi:hypothetical protein
MMEQVESQNQEQPTKKIRSAKKASRSKRPPKVADEAVINYDKAVAEGKRLAARPRNGQMVFWTPPHREIHQDMAGDYRVS